MSKRLHRIKPIDFPTKLKGIVGSEINVVLKTDQTYFGTLKILDHQTIELSDHRQHAHRFPYSQIFEVVADFQG